MSRIFLGVDGGQSSTNALIADETGRVLGSGQAGPCNHVGAAEGRERFTTAISECLAKAVEAANLPRNIQFEASCLGFTAGPADKEPILREMLDTKHLIVSSDSVIALAGATAGMPGIATVAGTGSVCFGRNAAGVTARAGGWGYSIGDEGSAYDTARQALRAALRYEEGWGPRTVLRELLAEATGIGLMHDLVRQFYTSAFPRPRIAGYAQLVTRAAGEKDEVAKEILENGVRQLVLITEAVRRQLFQPSETALVAYVGGMFRSPLVLHRFRALLEEKGKNRVEPPVYGPAAGALLEAFHAVGLDLQPVDVPAFDR